MGCTKETNRKDRAYNAPCTLYKYLVWSKISGIAYYYILFPIFLFHTEINIFLHYLKNLGQKHKYKLVMIFN